VFHGNPEKVFHEFFGGDNPFSGKDTLSPSPHGEAHSCNTFFS
jgi:hypothetical protein